MSNKDTRTRSLAARAFRRKISFLPAFFVLLCGSFFSGCSSAPEKADAVFSDRNTANKQLDLANHTANRGRYADALVILEDARRLAVSTDDPALRIKTSISRGNFLFALGRGGEAFGEWEKAAAEADSSDEPLLAALARICVIRGRIVLLAEETDAANAAEGAAGLKARLETEMAAVSSDPLMAAAGNIALGLAEKQLGRFVEAEEAVREALAFHEDNLDLEDAAYDWFIIASIRSMAGNYGEALSALRSAIAFDRRAENGFGLASSWQAMGDVHRKAGEAEEAREAWLRAAEIFRAIGLNELALKAEAALR